MKTHEYNLNQTTRGKFNFYVVNYFLLCGPCSNMTKFNQIFKKMPNAYFHWGNVVLNTFEQFDRQKQLTGQAKVVSDGHESIYWIDKVIYVCFDGFFFVLMDFSCFDGIFFFRKRLYFENFYFSFLKGRRSGLKDLPYAEL